MLQNQKHKQMQRQTAAIHEKKMQKHKHANPHKTPKRPQRGSTAIQHKKDISAWPQGGRGSTLEASMMPTMAT